MILSKCSFPPVVALAVLFSAAISCFGQTFRWNWREARSIGRDQSLRQATIGEQEKEAIVAVIVSQLERRRAGWPPENQTQRELALDTAIEIIDLNDDGTGELVARALGPYLCSPTGNCPLWIFQKRGPGYGLLLEGFGQRFTIEKSKTNQYRDVVISMHGSAMYGDLKLYRYESGSYQYAACHEYYWTALEDVGQVLEEPRVTPCTSR